MRITARGDVGMCSKMIVIRSSTAPPIFLLSGVHSGPNECRGTEPNSEKLFRNVNYIQATITGLMMSLASLDD